MGKLNLLEEVNKKALPEDITETSWLIWDTQNKKVVRENIKRYATAQRAVAGDDTLEILSETYYMANIEEYK